MRISYNIQTLKNIPLRMEEETDNTRSEYLMTLAGVDEEFIQGIPDESIRTRFFEAIEKDNVQEDYSLLLVKKNHILCGFLVSEVNPDELVIGPYYIENREQITDFVYLVRQFLENLFFYDEGYKILSIDENNEQSKPILSTTLKWLFDGNAVELTADLSGIYNSYNMIFEIERNMYELRFQSVLELLNVSDIDYDYYTFNMGFPYIVIKHDGKNIQYYYEKREDESGNLIGFILNRRSVEPVQTDEAGNELYVEDYIEVSAEIDPETEMEFMRAEI